MATHQLITPELGLPDKRRTASTPNSATSINTIANYASQATLDARLLVLGYPQKNIDSMTLNDKVYAVRLADDPTSI